MIQRPRIRPPYWLVCLASTAALAGRLTAQSPSGPIAPQPGTAIQQAPPQPKIGVRVALVNTAVTVRDSKGQMVHTLDAKNFRVTDNGVAQEISHFDMGGDPLSLVILVETSSRIDPFLPQVRRSGVVFAQTVMGPDAETAVIGFNDSVDKLQEFTHNADLIESTINHLKTGTSGSKLYDAMALGVEMLSGRPQPSADQPGRRRVLFVMSEATDIGSASRFGEVLRQAQLSNVTIYSVGLSTTRAELQATPRDTTPHPTPPGTFGAPPFPGTPQGLESDSARYGSGDLAHAIAWVVQNVAGSIKGNPLELATAGTGGVHLPTFKNRSIENAIDEIGGELHAQYSITYVPTGTNEAGYHEIKVLVEGKNLKVRARPGYYVAPPAS
jgi:VWFA-related protein